MIYPQMLLDLHREIHGDAFAGGGGASAGFEMGTGRSPDFAINHDPEAVAMHEINHPQTRHYQSDIFEVDPREATQGRPVGSMWFSPDCTFFSKSRGGKPIRHAQKKRRALAWIVKRWAGQVRPRVIFLENVEEFAEWCPLVAKRDPATGRVIRNDEAVKAGKPRVAAKGERVPVEDQQLVPCPVRTSRTFRQWKRQLEHLGYVVEHRELRACDYGAPTIRKRLFLVARCDGRPIVWPEPTHGPAGSGLLPYRTAGECVDWSIPMCSIFATPEEAKAWAKAHRQRGVPKRPLAAATLRRVARGVVRFVIRSPRPFVVGVGGRAAQTGDGTRALSLPYQTITAKGDAALVAPVVAQLAHGDGAGPTRRWGIGASGYDAPLPTIHAGGKSHALVGAFLAKHFTGVVGSPLDEPKGTVTTIDHDSLVAAHLAKFQQNSPGASAAEPLHTVMAGATRHALVYSFLQKYYGQGIGQELGDPAPTVTTKDRFGLVAVEVDGHTYVITDIAMRMLWPRELYSCQGFPRSYVIDRGVFIVDGQPVVKKLTKTAQVRMVGNSVSPHPAAALIRANVPEMIVRDEARPPKPRSRRGSKAVACA